MAAVFTYNWNTGVSGETPEKLLQRIQGFLMANGWKLIDEVYTAGALTSIALQGLRGTGLAGDDPLVRIAATTTLLTITPFQRWDGYGDAGVQSGTAVTVPLSFATTSMDLTVVTDAGVYVLASCLIGATRQTPAVLGVTTIAREGVDSDIEPMYGSWSSNVPGSLSVPMLSTGAAGALACTTAIGTTTGLGAVNEAGDHVLFPLYAHHATQGKLKGVLAGLSLGTTTLTDGTTATVGGVPRKFYKTAGGSAFLPNPAGVVLAVSVNTAAISGGTGASADITLNSWGWERTTKAPVASLSKVLGIASGELWQTLKFATPVAAAAVRLLMFKIPPNAPSGGWVSIKEVQAYLGTERVAIQSAEASSTYSASYLPANVLDNNEGSYWLSSGTAFTPATGVATSVDGYESLTLKLTRAVTPEDCVMIDSIRFKAGFTSYYRAFPIDLDVQVSPTYTGAVWSGVALASGALKEAPKNTSALQIAPVAGSVDQRQFKLDSESSDQGMTTASIAVASQLYGMALPDLLVPNNIRCYVSPDDGVTWYYRQVAAWLPAPTDKLTGGMTPETLQLTTADQWLTLQAGAATWKIMLVPSVTDVRVSPVIRGRILLTTVSP